MSVIRWPILLAGGICLLLVWQASRSSANAPAVVDPAVSHAQPSLFPIPSRSASEPATMPDLVLLKTKAASRASALFAVKDWLPPPPTVVPVIRPVATEAPRAPQMPFRYMGRLAQDEGKNVVFLVNGDVLHSVKVGDVIDERYKIKKIEGNVMTLVYLPLGQTQTLSLGGQP